MPLEQRLELEIGRDAMEEDDFDVDVVAILVEEILQEVGYGLERDVTTDC